MAWADPKPITQGQAHIGESTSPPLLGAQARSQDHFDQTRGGSFRSLRGPWSPWNSYSLPCSINQRAATPSGNAYPHLRVS